MNRTSHLSIGLFAVLALVAGSPGCASSRRAEHAAAPLLPARISHMVFATLNDPSRADALIADCDRLLTTIPGVVAYACGKHIDTGRATVDAAYDVGLYIGFETTDAYAVYVDHPNHVELLNTWGAEIKTLLIRDVEDATR